MLKTIVLVTRGILVNRRVRRWTMFILLLAAMLMAFAGTTFLDGPWGFTIYWAICLWLTLTSMLLALWDMLMIRVAARRDRRNIEKQMVKRPPDEEP
jgi:peptidoglycan/LPS O-acetylase OafA/YrhL